jgi:hypothetical protein
VGVNPLRKGVGMNSKWNVVREAKAHGKLRDALKSQKRREGGEGGASATKQRNAMTLHAESIKEA